jgi:hypothetical protein
MMVARSGRSMRRQLRDFSIRLVIVVAILLGLGRVFGSALLTPLLPALAWVIETVDDRLRVEQVVIAERRAEPFIELKVAPRRLLMVGSRTLIAEPGLYFEPAILVGSALQPVFFFLAIVLAWPVVRRREFGLRLLLAVPMVGLLLVSNVPLGFVGVIQDFRDYFPDAAVTPLVYWNDFLQTGGALALAIAAGVLTLSVAEGRGRAG